MAMNGLTISDRTRDNAAHLAAAADQSPHYVRSITEAGEQSEVIAQDDIYASNGMKLIAKGAKIDRSTWHRLADHKLRAPLDMMLVAADSVNEVSLARDIDRIIAADPILSTLLVRSGDPQSLKSILGQTTLQTPVAFRLTVMRNDRSRLYEHSLRVAVIAHSIGTRMKFSTAQLQHLLLASLCHDFGEMHTDPDMLAPDRAIVGTDRRFIYVHPITGYVVLQQMNGIPAEVMQAVLQHHERLDGSGYPYGDSADRISPLARVISVAETFEAVVRRFNAVRLNITFRLNQGRLDNAAINALYELLPGQVDASNDGTCDYDYGPILAQLHRLLVDWPALRDEIERNKENEPLRFLTDRMLAIQSVVYQAGLTPELLEFLDLEAGDAEVLQELNPTLDEIERLLSDIAHETDRKITKDSPCYATAARVLDLLQPEASSENNAGLMKSLAA